MSGQDVLFEVKNRAGVITLNRPKALNALTLGMVREMHPQLERWADDDRVHQIIIKAAGDKAFCAGGDIRALYDWGLARNRNFLDFYREEYLLNTFIKRYPKPYIALIDGIDMGGGVGVSIHGSHRVATERLTFAMPETGIGLFPDVGGTYFLPRLPGELGMFMALTGARLKAPDALYAGLATHYVPSGRLIALEEALSSTDDVEEVLKGFSAACDASKFEDLQAQIDGHFSKDSVEAIIKSLKKDKSEWAAKQIAIMASKSPTSQKIAYRQVRDGAKASFEGCMKIEWRMVNRIYEGHDFFEGIRAVVVDKDNQPAWKPGALEEVEEKDIERYFETLNDELNV
ncbi:MAG: enoyl-CoA hydratase/isomerase family protein [Alphaproteobacteria bacterium]|nr:enoyl-CoA hydratase/isomerase family protein [Alphaproteobacteria bacterium]